MDSVWPPYWGLFRTILLPDNIKRIDPDVHNGGRNASPRKECLMFSPSRWLLIPAVLTGWLGLTAAARAVVAPVIKDDGKFFSAEAVNKANAEIKKIAQDYNKDLLIETFPEVLADRKPDYK